MNPLRILIMAAGKGTRFKSSWPKVLHRLAGQSLASYVIKTAQSLNPEAIGIVVGHDAEKVRSALADDSIHFVEQSPQLGTGHAVQVAKPFWSPGDGALMILSGDVPLISCETLKALVESHFQSGSSVTLLSTRLDDPTGYGRVVRDASGEVVRIVEQKDATPEERIIQEVNTGIYCFKTPDLAGVIDLLSAANSQKEYYLPECVGLLKARNQPVSAVLCGNPVEVAGVNSRVELAQLEQILRERKTRELMREGVTLIDPSSTYISPNVTIGPDTVIYPNVYIEGNSRIGRACQIYPNVRITQSVLEDRVLVLDSSVIVNSHIESESQIGPFAHLRTDVEIGKKVRIGNFVELKKTSVGDGSTAAHLSYLGDTQIGRKVNVGAGTITCNYDGVQKHRTVIEDHVFIGSDSQLVAPVTVKEGAYVAAGSTITEEVPKDALAIARSPQVIKPDWARKRRESLKKG